MANGSDDDRHEPDFPSEKALLEGFEDLTLTPQEHQRIKNLVHGPIFEELVYTGRSYLIIGKGGNSGAATRRQNVVDLLNERPNATAVKLEDFGLTKGDIPLWSRVFDILCGSVTFIVGVFEDFDGDYVWEFGLLFAPEYRTKVWILKRRYEDDAVERERYDIGMAVSAVELFSRCGRVIEWTDKSDLLRVIEELP